MVVQYYLMPDQSYRVDMVDVKLDDFNNNVNFLLIQ